MSMTISRGYVSRSAMSGDVDVDRYLAAMRTANG
jgi:hypothetical protein